MSPRIGLNKEMILEAAAVLADEEGIHSVTLASLSKKLNVRPPSLYNHIEGLNGIRRELALFGLTSLYEEMAAAIQGAKKEEAVRRMAKAYMRFAKNRPGLYDATFVPKDGDKRIEEAGGKIVRLVLSVLKAYHLDADAAIHAVRGLRSILHGFAGLRQNNAFGLPYDIEESLDRTIRAYLIGLDIYQDK
ncbi:TetR/AcrR family transcriptional regulator [Bacillus sp. z60-18]|uniref:TetR/AcrR family transcriptional regulator n=1 Tax=unclassified Bacillus (in: firmicutes) TaxID=185979 RepID=UPI0024094AB4|nr:TetR/AcrR family transcriptional regulator [Bacillus sp. HSf4]WFA07284.1 WHG domain-containing protein [Bacillus sp. HSf4]